MDAPRVSRFARGDAPRGVRVSFEFFPPKTAEMEQALWEAISRLAPLIDGRHTVDAINAALAGVANPVEILLALTFLQRRKYIVEASEAVPAARLAFWDELGVDAEEEG